MDVLDVCCGSRMFWFNDHDTRALYLDRRVATMKVNSEKANYSPIVVSPDVLSDFRALPFADNSFWHVVFDPPHLMRESAGSGVIRFKYGSLEMNWETYLREGFSECFRVLKPHGTLIFKWAEVSI